MLFCTVGFVLLPTSYVWANPSGEAVVGGAATFQRDGNKLTVNQATDRLAVNWQSFNIGAGETTHFNMPSSTSAALNRVIGGNPSSIYGSLSANGILYLINPSGILVGPGGTVNAASFMASTLDVSTEQFMNAKNRAGMNFYGSSGESIINQGNITAEKGDVFLIAQKVENRGTINAANGTVGMVGSGQNTDVMVHEVGGKGFAIRVAQLQGEAATGSNRDLPDGEELLNEGSINAAQAELNASGNIYALAIRNSGTIRAKAVVANADGTVRLDGGLGDVMNTGTMIAKNAGNDATAAGGKIDVTGQNITASPESIITAAGGEQGGNGGSVKIDSQDTTIVQGKVDVAAAFEGSKGGKVQLLGERVGLFDGAKVDASGGAGGGTVLVGGDYLGGQTPRADLKDLAKQEVEPVKNAKATVMADTAEIKADATVNGDGGKVVLWSDNYTGFYGKVFARGGAKGGDGGFVETSSQRNLQAWGSVNASSPKGRAGTWLIDPDDITIVGGSATNNAVNNGGSFTATTNGATVGAGAIVAALTNGSSVSVTTSGGGTNSTGNGNILVTAPIIATNGGSASLTLTASPGSGQISGSGNISVGGGGSLNITFNADSIASYSGTIATAGGFFTANTVTGNQMSGSIATANGAVTINNTGAGAINLARGGINAGAGAVSITQSGAQNIILAGLTSSGVVSVTSQGGDIDLNGGSYLLTLTGATATFNANAGALAIDSGATFVRTTAALSLRGNGGITLDGDLFSSDDISLNSANDSITVSNTGSITGTADVNLGAGTDIILSGTINSSGSATGILTLQANGGSIQDGSGVGVLTPNNTTLTEIVASDGIRFNFGGNATFRAKSTSLAGEIRIQDSSARGSNLTISGTGITGGATDITTRGSLTIGATGQLPFVATTSFHATAGGGIIFGVESFEAFPLVRTSGLQQYDSPITLSAPVSPATVTENWLSAGSIVFGTVDSATAGAGSLGLAGTPDVQLFGLIGGNRPLNNFTTRGGSIGFNVATSRVAGDPAIAVAGYMSFDSADLILASSTWLSAGNDLIFGGDITGYRDGEFPVFQVNSGGGNVVFLGSIGNTAIPLGNLDVVSGSRTANSFDVLPPGTTAAGGEISIVGNIVTLPGTAPIIAGGNGNVGLTTYSATKGIVLSGNINTAGGANYDDTMIGGSLTVLTPLSGGLTPANIQVESNVTTRGGAINFDGPVFFTAASTLDTTVGNSGGAITFNDTTDGSAQATMNSGTAGITFSGKVGSDSNFNLAILGAGGVLFTDSVLLGSGANTINSLAGDVVFGSTDNPSTIDILNAGTLTMDLGNNSVDFYGEVGGTNPFGITVSSAGGIDFEENVTLGGNFNLSSEGTGVNFNGTLNGDHSVTINSTLGDISLGTVGDVIPIAGFSTSSGSGTLTLNGDISTEGGALNFGQEVSVTSDLTILTGLGLSPLGASISFTKAVLPFVDGVDLTIDPGSNGSVVFANGLGSSSDRFSSFTLLQGGGITIGGSATGIYTTGNIRILPKVFGSFPASTLNFNSENGDITLAQGAVLTGLFSGDNNNSDGSNFVAEALNGTLTINGVLDVSGGENDTSGGGGSGYNSGDITITAKTVSLNTLQALGGDADSVGNGGTGGDIIISSEDSLRVNSILTDGGTGERIVGGIGGAVTITRTGAVGEILIGTISSRGGDSTDSYGGNGGNVTIKALLGDLDAPTSFFTNGGEGSADAFAGLGGEVNLVASVGNISFQNQSFTLSGDGDISIIAGKSIVFATSADFTTPSKSSGGVVITSNEDALRADRRGVVTLQYGSANTGGELYMASSAYLISNGGKVALDVKNTAGLAGAMTLSGISTSAADLTGGSIEINQKVGSVLGNVTVSGSIDANGGDPASTGPRYGRNGGSILISGLAVSVQQINTSGSASLATATVPAFGGSGGDVTITGTSILIQAGTVPATGSLAINTSGGTGLGTGNANGGSGGNIKLNGNVTLDSGDASKTTIIFNTQGGTFAAGGVNGIGGNITLTGTLTGTETTSNTLDLRYGSGTVTLGDATPDTITLGTLITAADDTRSTGSLNIQGALDLSTLTTFARGYSVNILGGGTIENRVTFLNSGIVTIGASGVITTFTDGFDALNGNGTIAPSTLQLGGRINTVTATTGSILAGTTLLVADTTLNSAGNSIEFGGLDSLVGNSFDLTLAPGVAKGTATFNGAVGATTELGQITIDGGVDSDNITPVNFLSTVKASGITSGANSDLTFNNDVTLTNLDLGITTDLGGTITFNNQAYLEGDLTAILSFLGAGNKRIFGATTLTGGPIEFGGSGSYEVTIAGSIDGAQNLTLSGLGTKTFTGIVGGTTALGTGTGAAISMLGGDVVFGELTTASGIVSLANVALTGVTTLAAGDTGSSLTGNVDLLGATLTSAGNVELGSVLLGGAVKLDGTVLLNGTGAVTIKGAVTDNAGFTSFTQAGTAGKISFDENVTLDVAAGVVTLNGNVGLSGMSFSTAGTVTLGSALTSLITLTSGAVTLTGTGTFAVNGVVVGGGQDLTLSGTGGKTFAGSASGLGTLALTAGTGTFNKIVSGVAFNQSGGVAVLNGNGAFTGASTLGGTRTTLNGITFSSGTTAVTGVLTSTGVTSMTGGLITLNTASAVTSRSGVLTLGSAVSLGQGTTLTGAGAYQLSGEVNGANGLTLTGAGAKTFSGAVGTGTALTTITQNDASGLVTFAENVTMSGAGTFNANLVFDGLTMTSTGDSLTFGSVGGTDTAVISGATTINAGTDINLKSATTLNADLILSDADLDAGGTTTLSGTVTGASSNLTVTTDNLVVGNTVQTGSGVVSLVKKNGGADLIVGGVASGFLNATEISRISTSGGLTVTTTENIIMDKLELADTDQITGAFRMVTTGGGILVNEAVQINELSGSAAGALTATGGNLSDLLVTQSFRNLTLGAGELEYYAPASMRLSGVDVAGGIVIGSVNSLTVNGSVVSRTGGIGLGAGGDIQVSSRITAPTEIIVDSGRYFINSFNGNPFQSASTRVVTSDLFGATWPSNGAVPGLQVVYGVNNIGQLGANQIGVSTTLLAGNAGPFILEFTTGTGQPYILAQQSAIPPVMLPVGLTGGSGFTKAVSYSPDELEMMTPEERSAYENQKRQTAARVILQRENGEGDEIGAPMEGRTPQAATPAVLAPVAPTAQVFLEGKPLAGAKSDQERGDATRIIKLRPTRAVAVRSGYHATDLMESERMAAEVSVGAAPVAQSR